MSQLEPLGEHAVCVFLDGSNINGMLAARRGYQNYFIQLIRPSFALTLMSCPNGSHVPIVQGYSRSVDGITAVRRLTAKFL
jgi:hypothetical protein